MTPERSTPIWRQKFDVERTKSRGLEPDLDRLEREGYDSLTPDEFYRLKTWGVCSQRTPGLHMLRIRIPGGRIESGKLRRVSELSVEFADGSLHITSRQNLELHSVRSANVRRVLHELSRIGLTTRSACGHTVRNVSACSRLGVCAEEPFDVSPTVQKLHEFFLVRADHYNALLPRRLNVYVAGCSECMSHAQVNDLGFVAIDHLWEPGFEFWCAGSLASNPRLSHFLFGFVPVAEAVSIAEAVADVYCRHGFRDRPAKARLKFLVEEWGVERFREAVMARLREIRPNTRVKESVSAPSGPSVGPDRRSEGSHRGVFPQRQPGYLRIEARVPLGDLDEVQAEVLTRLAEAHGDGCIYLTPEQNAELHWVSHESASEVTKSYQESGLLPQGAGGLIDVLVCAGTEWCVWGVGDSRGLARKIEEGLSEIVVSHPESESLRVHISGCHHGCARHQAADVGLVATSVRDGDGEKAEGYEFFAGGRLGADPAAGRRIGRAGLADTESNLVELLRSYVEQRGPREDFAGWLARTGREVGDPA